MGTSKKAQRTDVSDVVDRVVVLLFIKVSHCLLVVARTNSNFCWLFRILKAFCVCKSFLSDMKEAKNSPGFVFVAMIRP